MLYILIILLTAKSRSTAGSASRSASSGDDDDFIVPTDSEVSYSGAIDADAESDSELESKLAKSKYKPGDSAEKKARRPAVKKNGLGHTDLNGQNFLLTAAEQRALEKKTDKKEKEDSFSFLQDIRDVSWRVVFNTHTDASFCLNRKTKFDRETRTTIPGLCTFQAVHGKVSPRSRRRCVWSCLLFIELFIELTISLKFWEACERLYLIFLLIVALLD